MCLVSQKRHSPISPAFRDLILVHKYKVIYGEKRSEEMISIALQTFEALSTESRFFGRLERPKGGVILPHFIGTNKQETTTLFSSCRQSVRTRVDTLCIHQDRAVRRLRY